MNPFTAVEAYDDPPVEDSPGETWLVVRSPGRLPLAPASSSSCCDPARRGCPWCEHASEFTPLAPVDSWRSVAEELEWVEVEA